MAAMKLRIMPSSPSSDIERIKQEAEKIIIAKGGKLHSAEIQPIAFGIRALILTVAWPEELEQERLEAALREIADVQSVEVIDFRRAAG